MAEASGSQDSANTRPNAVASSSNSTSNRPHEIALPPRPPHPSTSTSGPMSPSGDSAGSHSIESALGQGGSTRLFPMRSVLYPSTSGGVVSAASTAPTTAATASPASNSQSIASTSRQKVHAPPSRDGSQSVGSVRDETAQLSEEAVERLNASNEGRQPVTVQAPPLTVKRGGETDTSATKTGGSDSVASKFHMTARFEHAVSEDGGNWIITGRGGHLQKCEDEVRFPGAACLGWQYELTRFSHSQYTRRAQYRLSVFSSLSTSSMMEDSKFSRCPRSVCRPARSRKITLTFV